MRTNVLLQRTAVTQAVICVKLDCIGFHFIDAGFAAITYMLNSLWKKIIEKPYSGKLNSRFDEGELEIEHG